MAKKKRKLKIKNILLLLIVVLLPILLLVIFSKSPFKVEMDSLVLDYGKEIELEFKANFKDEDVTDKVKIEHKINSKKLGKYEVKFIYKKDDKEYVTSHEIEVKDISKPEIILTRGEEITVLINSKYKEPGYEVTDNYDTDLNDSVKVSGEVDTSKEGIYELKYKVKDSSGNETSITKNLIYEDKESPKLTLNGSDLVYAFVGEGYNDLGVKANDNCMGDVTSRVTVDSKVNTSVSGKYDVIYNVSDNNGNTNSIKRSVVVSERNRPGTVYLTFDDGPQNGTTNVILDILKEEGVEATFFVTSKGPDNLIKRMHDEGHTVALHTATHNYATVYASVDSYFNDLITVQNRVKNITGQTSYIIRFPGGSSNTVSRNYSQGIMSTLTSEVIRRGYRYYDWNVSSGDAAGGSPSSEQIKNNVINSLRKDRSNMVLMHDIKACTRDALRSIIRYGKENGYTFEKITMNTEMVRQRVNN